MSAPALRLRRPARAGAVLSLTPLVDVLLILVVFFLVTSTYLDLAMIPMVETEDDAPAQAPPAPDAAGPLLIRLAADGQAWLSGRPLDADALAAAVATRGAAAAVLVLPSPAAPAQALVRVLDMAAAAGARQVRVVRIEAAP